MKGEEEIEARLTQADRDYDLAATARNAAIMDALCWVLEDEDEQDPISLEPDK